MFLFKTSSKNDFEFKLYRVFTCFLEACMKHQQYKIIKQIMKEAIKVATRIRLSKIIRVRDRIFLIDSVADPNADLHNKSHGIQKAEI